MATLSRITLSGSTDGRGVKVAATAIGSGTTIHTVSTGIDEIDLYASNTDTVSRKLTIGWGGVTDPDDLIEVTIPAESGLVPVALKLPLKNSLVVKAACSVANVVILFGGATRVT